MHRTGKLPHEAVLEARMVREANLITQMKSIPLDQFGKQLEDRVKSAEAEAA